MGLPSHTFPAHLLPKGVKRKAKPQGMNGLEIAYRDHLRVLQVAGEVVWFKAQPFRLTLAERCTYQPDFMVQHADGQIEIVETKGWEREDAIIKFKTAAAMFPCFVFRMVKKKSGGWVTTRELNNV